MRTLTNKELMRLIYGGDAQIDVIEELIERLRDGRAILADARETLSIDCNACGNTVDFHIDDVDVY